MQQRRHIVRQYREEPHDCDGEVLGVSVALRERRAVHEQNGHSDGDVEGEAQGEGVEDAVEFAQSGMREIAELNLARKVETCEECYKNAVRVGLGCVQCAAHAQNVKFVISEPQPLSSQTRQAVLMVDAQK